MKTLDDRSGPLRPGRALCYAFIAALLAACGGGGGGSNGGDASGESASALTITDDNAPAITQQLLAASQFMLEVPESLYGLGTDAQCDDGGTSTVTGSTESHATITLSDCKPVYDEAEKVIFNGSLDYQFGSDIYPVHSTIDGFSWSDTEYDSSGDPAIKQVLKVDGDFISQSELNLSGSGSFYASYMNNADVSENFSDDWGFENYQTNGDESGLGPINVTGRQILYGLGGYVDIATPQDLSYDEETNCPLTGQMIADGADDTYLQVAFDGGDTVTVNVNGNATAFDCEEFQSWFGVIINPFEPGSAGRSLRVAPTGAFGDPSHR